jgi:glutaredoxin
MCTFRLFWKEDCPKCPAAKHIIQQLRSDGYQTMEHDLETTSGLTEAALYGVLSTPTILITDEQENVVAEWRGSIPTVEEAKRAVRANQGVL